MGFNNRGVDCLLQRLAATDYRGVLGINIGKNFDTPLERAAQDYLFCLRRVYPHASYVTVNVSSPNTKGLRDLQDGPALEALLGALRRERTMLADKHGRYVPLAVKVAPDLDTPALEAVADAVLAHGVDGVIATNTTIQRPGLGGEPLAAERGGLSGEPLRPLADAAIATLAKRLDGAVPIIGLGGVMSGADARAKLTAGATLVQVYTGLIYRGPELVRECVEAMSGEAGRW
jgi:dihydroorotate dehydrogenase